MSFGKLYSYSGNPRTTGILVAAHENGLKLDLVETRPMSGVSDDYRKLNKLGKIPTFEGADNFVLSESMAIAIYVASANDKTALLASTKQDYASIVRWMSYSNTEILPNMGAWFRPLLGMDSYNKKNVADGMANTLKALKTVEDHLLINTYLVGERITLADYFMAGMLARGYEMVFDAASRKEYPNTFRWFETVTAQSAWTSAAGKPKLCEKALENKPPASAQKPKEEKKKETPAAKPKAAAKEADDEEDEAPAAPKPKHPLEALGRPTFAMDDWKRKYKNTDNTRTEAMPWFWENVNFEEYSIYQFDFKYNEELTLTFMSSNQVSGFFNRLEASRKYLMGCGSVYGKTNESVIRGAFLVRGQEAAPAFDVAPDWESYSFTKLDPTKPEDRETVDSMWSWDKPISIGGKEYEWADGKIFV